MLRHRYAIWVAAALVVCFPAIGSCAGTPESTLEEVVFTDQIDVVIQHLPDSIADAFRNLSPEDRNRAAEALLVKKRMAKEGIRISQTGAEEWQVADDKGETKGRVRLKHSFVSGIDALIVLELQEQREDHESRSPSLAFISMQLQDGEWRIMQLGGGELRNIEDMLSELKPSSDHNDASAVGSLRTLNTALITYQATYPDAGFAPTIESLGGDGQPSPQRAGLIDPTLASGMKSGYRFQYTRTSSSSYTITARPVEFGKTGTRNFFTDESGVIRSTREDREANAGDEAL